MVIDPFISAYEETEVPRALSLFELNARVRATLQHTMPYTYWVKAEISELRAASNGHCYLELVEKHERTGSLVAKARAIIWKDNYLFLAGSFEEETGQRLTAGIKVMLEVAVTFHELYGLSLTVTDIDSSYTLGDLVRRRQEIVRRLTEDGVIDLNKELPLPRLLKRIAVISSAGAAGYGDFCNQLAESGFDFKVRLFPAVMQGERVESSVIEALDAILYETEVWDAVVIIRGGGATTDLHGFDSYLLAANVAQYPLPVLTGIGHERDDTIVDLVAHTRLKTPTAVAAFLIESRRNESDLLSALVERFRQALTARIDEEALRIDDCRKRLEIVSVRLSSLRRERLAAVVRRLELASLRTLADRRAARERLVGRLRYATLRRLQTAEGEVALLDRRLPAAATGNVDRGRSRLEYLSGIVRLSDPAHILAKGYSVTLKDGRPVRSASELALGDLVTMRYMCGTAESRITQISISTPDA